MEYGVDLGWLWGVGMAFMVGVACYSGVLGSEKGLGWELGDL